MPKQTTPPAPASEPETPPTNEQPATGSRFFTWLRSIGLVRQPGWIGGVSVAIADRIGIDVLIVRGILVVVAVFGGPALLLYAAAWLLLPDNTGKIHLEQMLRGRFESPLVGIAVLVALSVLPVAPSVWSLGSAFWGQPYWGDSIGRGIWTLVVVGLLVWFVVWMSRRAHPTQPGDTTTAPTTPSQATADTTTDQVADWRDGQNQFKTEHEAFRQQQAAERHAANQAASAAARTERMARADAQRAAWARSRSHPLYSLSVIGFALVAGAITALALGNGAPDSPQFLAGLAVAVGVLGLGIIVNGARGRRSGGASGLAVILLLPLIFAGIFPQGSNLHYVGDWRLAPSQNSTRVDEVFVQGVGNVRMDLTGYVDGDGPNGASLNLVVGTGNTTLLLPRGEDAHIVLQTGSGAVTTDTGVHLAGGRGHTWSSGNTSAESIDIHVVTGVGNITVRHEPATTGSSK